MIMGKIREVQYEGVTNKSNSLEGFVGLFFVASDGLLLHTYPIENGERYGDFVNYPESHDAVWQREYLHKYHVDYDFFPRGRIIFNRVTNVYKLFYDSCADAETNELSMRYPEGRYELHLDEHYQCHKCNRPYIR